MAKYLILRDLSREGPPRPVTRGGPAVLGMDAEAPPEPVLRTVDADDDHAAEAAADLGAQCMARVMPIAPIEMSDATAEDAVEDDDAGATWGVRAVQADQSHVSGQSVTVAILYSGIRADHAAFPANRIKIVAEDFTDSGSAEDQGGHGTHCAATIVGRDVAGRRIGVAPGVRKLLAARVFAPGVTTTSQMLAEALQWAFKEGAQIISMSLSFNFADLVEDIEASGVPKRAAFALALAEFQNNILLFDSLSRMLKAKGDFPGQTGAILVGAAGNHSLREPPAGEPPFTFPVAPPNSLRDVISVGSLRRRGGVVDVANDSNVRPTMVAPGVGVLSAHALAASAGELVRKSGTSMACPHVAGLAALWWDALTLQNLPANAQSVDAALRASCRLDRLRPGLGMADRGSGMPSAPLG